MNRCTIIDRLTDDYGIKPENLTEREKAIIGLCTGEFLENEEQALSLGAVVGRSEQLVAFCRWYNQAIPSYETTEEEIVETYLRESN